MLFFFVICFCYKFIAMRTLLYLLYFCSPIFLFAQSPNQLEKRLHAEEINAVDFKFDYAQLELKPWNQKLISIELTIQSNVPDALIELLIKTGRYEMQAQEHNARFAISLPKMLNYVIVKGREVEEDLSVVVKAPPYYVLEDHSLQKNEKSLKKMMSNFTARSDEKVLDPEKWLEKMKIIKEPVEWHFEVISSLGPELAATQIVFTTRPSEGADENSTYLTVHDIVINGKIIDRELLELD